MVVYCEEMLNLWGLNQPLNLITNFSFIFVAILLFQTKETLCTFKALAALTALVGIGSFVFHFLPNPITQLLDVIPIFILCTSLIFQYSKLFFKNENLAYRHAFVFLVSTLFCGFFISEKTLNGSFVYIPIIVFLFFYSYKDLRSHNSFRLFYITGLFIISFSLRSLDLLSCDYLKHGTHFLWHILCAFTIYFLIIGLYKKTKNVHS